MSSPLGRQDADIVANHESLRRALTWLLTPSIFAVFRCGAKVRWKPRMLAAAALLWATSAESNLKDRFGRARRIVNKIFRWQPPAGATYQGFVKVLRKWHGELAFLAIDSADCFLARRGLAVLRFAEAFALRPRLPVRCFCFCFCFRCGEKASSNDSVRDSSMRLPSPANTT